MTDNGHASGFLPGCVPQATCATLVVCPALCAPRCAVRRCAAGPSPLFPAKNLSCRRRSALGAAAPRAWLSPAQPMARRGVTSSAPIPRGEPPHNPVRPGQTKEQAVRCGLRRARRARGPAGRRLRGARQEAGHADDEAAEQPTEKQHQWGAPHARHEYPCAETAGRSAGAPVPTRGVAAAERSAAAAVVGAGRSGAEPDTEAGARRVCQSSSASQSRASGARRARLFAR